MLTPRIAQARILLAISKNLKLQFLGAIVTQEYQHLVTQLDRDSKQLWGQRSLLATEIIQPNADVVALKRDIYGPVGLTKKLSLWNTATLIIAITPPAVTKHLLEIKKGFEDLKSKAHIMTAISALWMLPQLHRQVHVTLCCIM